MSAAATQASALVARLPSLHGGGLILRRGSAARQVGPVGAAASNTELGATILVVTHDPAVSAQVRRTVAIRDGRTSSETLRHGSVDELGNAERVSVEYAVLDRAGRVQLPREMTARLGMRDRVRVQEQPDHIGVWPDQSSRPAPGED